MRSPNFLPGRPVGLDVLVGCEQRERLELAGKLVATLRARREVNRDELALVGRDRIDRVRAEELANPVVIQGERHRHRNAATTAVVSARSFARPERILLLTVPSGSASSSATSR